jgi:hypothetical protein
MENEKMTVTLDTEDMGTVLANVGFVVSAGTVPAVGVPASRLALAVLHPGRFWTFAGGVRFST